MGKTGFAASAAGAATCGAGASVGISAGAAWAACATVGAAAGADAAVGGTSGALLVPHAITNEPIKAAPKRGANMRIGLIISIVAASTTPKRLLSSSRQLHIHHALVFSLLDLLMSGHSIRVGG